MTNSSQTKTRNPLEKVTMTCGRCGSWCDDLTRDQAGQQFEQDCQLIHQLALPQPTITATIAGQAVTPELALNEAVQILITAKRPLIWGLHHATCEAQTLAINVAEALRGLLLTPDDDRLAVRGSLVSRLGEARTTLGEIQRFADLVICLDCRPWELEPRWTERWRMGQQPETRQVVTLETSATPSTKSNTTSQAAIPGQWQRLECPLDQLILRTTEWQARQARQLDSWRQRTSTQRELSQDAAWDQLAEQFATARYPVVVYHAEQLTARYGAQRASRLIAAWEEIVLGASANQRTSLWPMRGADNSAGAEYLLTARTGYPGAIDWSSGTAEHRPWADQLEAVIATKRIDVLLCVGDLPPQAWLDDQSVQRIPCIVFNGTSRSSSVRPAIEIRCREFSTAEAGTIVRSDGVPIPLRPWQVSPLPALATSLEQLLTLIRRAQRAATEFFG